MIAAHSGYTTISNFSQFSPHIAVNLLLVLLLGSVPYPQWGHSTSICATMFLANSVADIALPLTTTGAEAAVVGATGSVIISFGFGENTANPAKPPLIPSAIGTKDFGFAGCSDSSTGFQSFGFGLNGGSFGCHGNFHGTF